MQIGKYLEKYQPVIYKTFVNSLNNKALSHAYLLVGNPGTPLLDTAKYLAKTILCDDPSPLACDTCITCLRFDSENYPDVIMLDGSKGTIKKDDILNIEARFDKTALDEKGIMIYIINLVENMTIEAVNSMLKFLEEPGAEIYAFLTTNNENNVLQTIISRCQTLHLKSRDREEVIEEAIELGVERSDAEILSYFYNDGELIQEFINSEADDVDDYKNMKNDVMLLLNSISEGTSQDAIYVMEKEIISKVKTKNELRYFIDMLTQFFEDLVNLNAGRDVTLKSYSEVLTSASTKIPHVKESLLEILKQRNLTNLNTNISLQLDHIIHYITKE